VNFPHVSNGLFFCNNNYSQWIHKNSDQHSKSDIQEYVCIGCVTLSRLNAKIVHEMKDDGGGGTVDDLQL
jgi:hypothetical protein